MSTETTASTNGNIVIRDLNVFIEGRHILKNINLDIPSHAITCIIGPSGCGKSTLLKAINRLHDDNYKVKVKGSIIIDGEDIYGRGTEVTHIRKKLGLVSQRPTPLPMSIYDNIAFGVRLHKLAPKRDLNDIVESNLRAAGLWEEVHDRLSAPANALSIGQQQRLCLARGLAVKPLFLLGYESTSALDPVSSRRIEDLFVSLKEKYGIIMVTHTLHQAMRVADHVVFIHQGEIIENGTANDVFHHSTNPLTLQYLAGVQGTIKDYAI